MRISTLLIALLATGGAGLASTSGKPLQDLQGRTIEAPIVDAAQLVERAPAGGWFSKIKEKIKVKTKKGGCGGAPRTSSPAASPPRPRPRLQTHIESNHRCDELFWGQRTAGTEGNPDKITVTHLGVPRRRPEMFRGKNNVHVLGAKALNIGADALQ